MVLGLGSKGKKGTPVSLAFDITVKEVKPWPSKSLPPLVLIQWQRGDKRSGSTKGVGGESNRICFNHSFTIPVTLYKLPNAKKDGSPGYHKKCIVFTVCNAQPGSQPLGRAVLDLAGYAELDRSAVSTIPIAAARKEYGALGTPQLSLTISPEGSKSGVTANRSSSSVSPSPSADEADNHASLIAALESDEEEEDEDEEIADFTDEEEEETDDSLSSSLRKPVSSSSSSAAVASPPESGKPDDARTVVVDSVSASPTRPPPRSPPPPPPALQVEDNKNDSRVQRVMSSVGQTSPAPKSAASAAAVSAYAAAAKRRGSFNSSPSRGSSDGSPTSSPAPTPKPPTNVLQAARMKYAEGAGERSERIDKKAVEEARQRQAAAEARAAAAVDRAKQLEEEMENMKAELRDAAALELALYSVVAQHGSSSHKIHAPARRLARIYMHACKHCSQHARASTARTCASGLVVVVRACENDVSRLTFWWSNVVVFREMISQELDVAIPPATTATESDGELSLDWRETSTLTSTLERIEAWIFGRLVECIWWQSLTPHMQSATPDVPSTPGSAPPTPSAETSVVSRLKKSVRGFMVSDLATSRQGTVSIEIWKSAFLDALQRICPVRAGGHDCGCLHSVTRMIVEQCVARLDVAMFNAILRDMEENVPTDPISDPITDLSVLPISPDNVSFGGGAQLKNVVNTWSTWLLTITAEPGAGESAAAAAAQENVEKGTSHFTLLRAMSDLLMLPKDMLMDKSVRKEVCPALSLLLIRRVLSKFIPDEFSPDPVPPSLVAALNAEISMERQRVGEEDISPTTVIMASAPPVVYFPPSSATVRNMLNGDKAKLSRSASLFRKGHTSDDELEEMESPLFLLVDNPCLDNSKEAELTTPASHEEALAKRYRLLRQVWNSSSTS